jgi:hypothetical protein
MAECDLFKSVLNSRSRILQCSRSRIFSVQPEPHPLTAAGAVKRCGSGAKPDVQNRTIKKKQVLRSRIILMRFQVKKFDAGAGAASCCGYGSTKMMRLRLHNTGKNSPASFLMFLFGSVRIQDPDPDPD